MAAPSSMIDPQPAVESYLWTFPGCPVRIALDLEVVEDLSRELGQPAQRETGGLLLGYADPETGRTTTITRRASLRSRFHSNRFVLSPEEISEFEAQLCPDKDATGLRIIGYYRTHLSSRPRLTKDDLSVITQCFQDPANVFLIVNPAVETIPVGGFFFWDKGRIFDAFSFMEFSLDRQTLAAGECSHEAPFCLTEDPRDEQAADEAVAPAASNFEYLHTYKALDEQAAGPAQGNRAFLLSEVVAVCLLLIAVIAALLPRAPKTKTHFTATALQLSVQKEPADLRISWDTRSPLIRAAKSGRLLIDDGSPKDENLTLGPVELQSGPVLYSLYSAPASSVRFRLEITGPDGPASSQWVGMTLTKSDLPPAVESADRVFNAARQNVGPVSRKRFVAPPIAEASEIALQPPTLPAPDLHGAVAPPLARAAMLPALSLPPVSAPAKPTFTAPVLLKRVAPEFPVTLEHYSINGVRIHLLLQIDESGRVTGGRSLTAGTKLTDFLATVALESAKRWRFAPARLGDKNVPGEAVADFVFSNKP